MLGLSPFGDVPKDEDHPDDIASVIFDGRGTVVDGSLAAVSGDEQSMFAEPDGQPSLDDLPDRLLDRLSGRLMDDAKDTSISSPAASASVHPVSFSATGLR